MNKELCYGQNNMELTVEQAHEILDSYHKDYEGFTTINREENVSEFLNLKYFDFNNFQINNLVLYWQKTQDRLVYDAIYETYMIIYKKMLPRFLSVSHTIKKDANSYDLDLFQDYIFIMHKCMCDYKFVENPSFKSYAMNWFQFYLGEQIRKQYFSLLNVPQNIIKKSRKKNRIMAKENCERTEEDNQFLKETQNENYVFIKNELEEGITTIEIEDTILDSVFDEKIVKIINKLIEKEEMKSWHFDCFLKKFGIFGREYKQTELAKIYKVSDSTISKAIKQVTLLLSKQPYLKELYFGNKI